MITNKTSRSILAGVLVAFAGTIASAEVLVENDFDSTTGGDIGGAFLGGGFGGTGDPDTGVITCPNANNWGGFGMDTGYDASTADSLTVIWTVESFTTNSPANKWIWSEGWAFGVRAGSASGASNWDNTSATYNPKVVFRASNNAFAWYVTDVGTNSLISSEQLVGFTPSVASLLDGFTVTLTVKSDNTWELVTSGFSSDVSTSGALSENVTFAALASNVQPITNLGGEGASCVMSYVQLSAATPVAPPGTLIHGR